MSPFESIRHQDVSRLESRQKPHPLDAMAPWIEDSYARVALVSHPRHVAALDVDDATTLIVSCNWLLWQKLLEAKRHAVHIEQLHKIRDLGHLRTDIYLLANDWVYVGDRDATMFHGVSLGRKFLRETSLVLLERELLTRMFGQVLARWQPKSVLFFDIHTEFSVLSAAEHLALVGRIASAAGVGIVDRSDPPGPRDREMPDKHLFGALAEILDDERSMLKPRLGRAFELALATASRVRLVLTRRKPRVLILTSQLTGIPLIESFDGQGITPLYFAKWFPRKRNLAFVLRALARGVAAVAGLRPKLTASDTADLSKIERTFGLEFDADPHGANADIIGYVRSRIFATGRFRDIANEVKGAEALLNRFKPSVVFTDGLQNNLSNIMMELARPRGIKTVSTWTAHALQDARQPILGGDPRYASKVDRFLTWGENHERWLAANADGVEAIRTGSPIAARIASPDGPSDHREQSRHALVLQYSVSYYDPYWPQTQQFPVFIDIVRMLRELGFEAVRLKLHPGCSKTSYYEEIANHYGLRCEVVRDGAFAVHVAWSDIVIGPAQSGAMLETMAAGKPYYPLLIEPTAMNRDHLDGCRTFGSVDELRIALAEQGPPNTRTVLDYFTGIDQFPDPGRAMWTALRRIAESR